MPAHAVLLLIESFIVSACPFTAVADVLALVPFFEGAYVPPLEQPFGLAKSVRRSQELLNLVCLCGLPRLLALAAGRPCRSTREPAT